MKMKEKSEWKGDGSGEMAALGDQLRETRKTEHRQRLYYGF